MTHVHLPLTPDWLFWQQPWVWLLLLLLALPAYWWFWLQPRRRTVLRYSAVGSLREVAGRWRGHLRLALPILRTFALGSLIVAAARPQMPNESRQVRVEGIAIQMVIDVSSSMLDTDLARRGTDETRLDVVKDVFRRFVLGNHELPGRHSDLIGIIRFARYPDSVCPLTLDRDALLDVLAETRTVRWHDRLGMLRGDPDEDGTAIGDGLALAVERLKDLERTTGSGEQFFIESRVVILLTDGENNAGMITPRQAGELAATYGIKVYTILAGSGQRMPFGPRRPIDDADLKYIAEVTGGKYFRSDDRAGLEAIYAEIDRLERTETEEHSYVEWGELAWGWLLVAFVTLGLQLLLDATWLRKIP